MVVEVVAVVGVWNGVVEVVAVRTSSSEDCCAGGSPTVAIQEGVGAAAASTNTNIDTHVCIGKPQATASKILQRRMVGDVLSGTIALEGNGELPTEPPLPDVDDDLRLSFEPPLPSRLSHDAGFDVESQAIGEEYFEV